MEAVLCCSVASTRPTTFATAGISIFSAIFPKINHAKFPALSIKATPDDSLFPITCFSSLASRTVGVAPVSTSISSTSHLENAEKVISYNQRHWMVIMETPPEEITAKPQVIDYYVNTLESVLGCKKDAQKCMYDASCDTHFGFCCDIDEETAYELAGMPVVLSVKPDPDFSSVKKDYSCRDIEFKSQAGHFSGSTLLFPVGTTKFWLVRTGRPTIGAIRKAQVVDYYVQVLMRVLGNEKDAQMCMYHVSWQSNYGFCCELDDGCAQELAGMPGIISIQLDDNFGSHDKDYGGESRAIKDSAASIPMGNIKTKKLFVTGLSFYTSEKTLSAAFEGFGELVEVKVIMDKISKRSKGYAFVEYTTEEAASTALREMNGKIINGWMITVDVAKKSPTKYDRRLPRPTS